MSLWKSSIDQSLADVEQASAFSAEGEAFLKPGGLMVAWESRLDDFESLSTEEVQAISERFEQALGQLGDMDMLHITGCQHRTIRNASFRRTPRRCLMQSGELRLAMNVTGSITAAFT